MLNLCPLTTEINSILNLLTILGMSHPCTDLLFCSGWNDPYPSRVVTCKIKAKMKVCSCPQSSEWINFPHSASCIILLFLTLKCIPWVFSEPGHHSLPSHFFFLKVETNFLSIPQSIYYKQNNKKNYVKYKMSVFLKHFLVKSV